MVNSLIIRDHAVNGFLSQVHSEQGLGPAVGRYAPFFYISFILVESYEIYSSQCPEIYRIV